jgi:hypothetical protein
MLDYNSLSMLFSFVWVGVQSAQGMFLDYVSGGWVRESCVVCVAHLLGLKVYAGSFETGQQGEMVCHFSQGRHLLGLGTVQCGICRLPWVRGPGCRSV